jgi:hypothetical protein
MLGVKTIKRLSKRGKLKLQYKLQNGSLNVKSRKVKKIIFVATMALIIGSLCYTYLPSRKFVLTAGSKLLKFKSSDSTAEIVQTRKPSTRAQVTILVLSTTIIALVKFSLVHSNRSHEVFDSVTEFTTSSTIEDNPFSLVAGMIIFTIFNGLLKIVTG